MLLAEVLQWNIVLEIRVNLNIYKLLNFDWEKQ
jgi:hypothetical protein